jgi:hypothetical protein
MGRRYLPVAPRELASDERDVEVVLIRGAPLRGRVVAPDGTPLASVYIEAVERPSDRLLPPVLTDEDGRFEAIVCLDAIADLQLDGVARSVIRPEKQRIGVTHLEVPWRGRWTGLAPGPIEHALRADVLVRRDLRVRVETPDGRPAVKAIVSTQIGRWSPFESSARTNEEGLAVLPGCVARARRVLVDASTAEIAGGRWVSPDPLVLDGSESEVMLVLRPAATISGRVLRAGGGAVTWCGIDVLHGEREVARGTSRGDGTFEVALPDDAPAPLRLAVRHYDKERRCWEGGVDDVWPGADDVAIEVTLPE